MSGAFSSSAFDTNAFSVNAWDFGTTPPPAVVVGGHYGKKHKQREFKDELEAKQRLRQQITEALDGPHAEVVEEVLSEFIVDEPYKPLIQRVDWDKIYRQLDLVETTVLLHLQEEDDDEDLLLLNG